MSRCAKYLGRADASFAVCRNCVGEGFDNGEFGLEACGACQGLGEVCANCDGHLQPEAHGRCECSAAPKAPSGPRGVDLLPPDGTPIEVCVAGEWKIGMIVIKGAVAYGVVPDADLEAVVIDITNKGTAWRIPQQQRQASAWSQQIRAVA